ncbi:MAG: response regulator receiver protein [Alphaproteobacteria bacterium]|nr:response regulator receiver protein [Alphaproteobacteria bacterium]
MSTQLKVVDSHSEALRAAAYVNDPESAAILKRCFGDLGLMEGAVNRGTIETAIKDLDRNRSPQVLVVDIAGLELPLEAMQRLSEVCEPGVEVLVVGERNDIALYRSLARMGVAEYVFKPLTYEIISEILARVTSGTVQQRDQKLGKLVNVLGVRGGVGASTIASSLAWHLSESVGRRVALVDFDISFGNAAMLLDSPPNHAFYEALETSERVDMLLLERATTKVTERLFLCSAMEPIDASSRVTGAGFHTIVSLLRQKFHYVISDLPAGRNDLIDRVVFEDGALVLVSDGSLASAREVSRWRSYFGASQAGRYLLHIQNKVGGLSDLKAKEFETAVGQPADIFIPFDKRVAAAANVGGASAMTQRALVRAAGQLASKLAGHQHETAKQGLFARLFRKKS